MDYLIILKKQAFFYDNRLRNEDRSRLSPTLFSQDTTKNQDKPCLNKRFISTSAVLLG